MPRKVKKHLSVQEKKIVSKALKKLTTISNAYISLNADLIHILPKGQFLKEKHRIERQLRAIIKLKGRLAKLMKK